MSRCRAAATYGHLGACQGRGWCDSLAVAHAEVCGRADADGAAALHHPAQRHLVRVRVRVGVRVRFGVRVRVRVRVRAQRHLLDGTLVSLADAPQHWAA
eukprot:scaffold131998_cov48-Phaeocystis_antarctica.AAC.1